MILLRFVLNHHVYLTFSSQKLELFTNEYLSTMKTSTTRTITWLHWKSFQLLVPQIVRSNSHLHTTSWLSNQTSLEECLMRSRPVRVCHVDSSFVAIMKMWGTQASVLQLSLCQSCLRPCCLQLSISVARSLVWNQTISKWYGVKLYHYCKTSFVWLYHSNGVCATWRILINSSPSSMISICCKLITVSNARVWPEIDDTPVNVILCCTLFMWNDKLSMIFWPL